MLPPHQASLFHHKHIRQLRHIHTSTLRAASTPGGAKLNLADLTNAIKSSEITKMPITGICRGGDHFGGFCLILHTT